MGLFDSFKKKAQDALKQASGSPEPQQPQQPQQPPQQSAAPRARAAGPGFEWDGDTYPLPSGWSGLSMEDWFLKLEQTRDRLMHADEEDLEPMSDEDGEPLDPEEVLLIKLGFQNGHHWEAFRSWGVTNWAAKTGDSPTDIEFRMGGIAREKIMAQKAGAMRGGGGGGGGALEPVEGVSVEQWAQVQAKIAGGGNLDALLSQARIDHARWDRVSAEWMARMQTDTTATIATVYGNAFAGAAQGQYGAQAAQAAAQGVGGNVGAEPIPFERFVEIQEAMGAASAKGQDPTAVLASFGLKIVDWSNVGMYWNKRMQQEATKYYELFTMYQAKYHAKYNR
jgi:hypothetical protein